MRGAPLREKILDLASRVPLFVAIQQVKQSELSPGDKDFALKILEKKTSRTNAMAVDGDTDDMGSM